MNRLPASHGVTTKVLFVCTHNAARSRMAEALLRHWGGVAFEVTSAGFESRSANPLVIEAMDELGVAIEVTAPQPTVFELFKQGRFFHYVITVCDEDQGERCPLFPGVVQRLTWGIPAVASLAGTHAERLAGVVRVRDLLSERIRSWLEELESLEAQ